MTSWHSESIKLDPIHLHRLYEPNATTLCWIPLWRAAVISKEVSSAGQALCMMSCCPELSGRATCAQVWGFIVAMRALH